MVAFAFRRMTRFANGNTQRPHGHCYVLICGNGREAVESKGDLLVVLGAGDLVVGETVPVLEVVAHGFAGLGLIAGDERV